MNTMQIVNQLDALHRKYNQCYYWFAVPVLMFGFAFFSSPMLGRAAGVTLPVLMITSFVILIVISGRMSKIHKEYQFLYKNSFVVSVLNQTFSDVRVNWEQGFTTKDIEQMGILKMGNRFHSEDFIHGVYQGVSFDQSDVTIRHESGSGKNRHTTTYFKGRVFAFDFQKNDIYSVGVLSKNFFYSGNYNGLKHESVEMESETFNKMFQVKAIRSVDAFYVLTPQMMECLMNLQRKAGNLSARYFGGKLYVAINISGNAFDGNIKKPVVYVDEINKIKHDCGVIIDIINKLKLQEGQ